MRSEISFASLANYHSRAKSELAVRSQQLCGSVKSGNLQTLRSLAERLKDAEFAGITAFLAPDRVLVPVPGSGKTAPGNLWVPALICNALRAAGFGSAAVEILRRETAVPKSAFASPGNRPTAKSHFDSMRADAALDPPSKVTLVDDVLTKGSTTAGAFLRIKAAFPAADVQVFAVFKTCNFQPDLQAFIDPTIGTLRYDHLGDYVSRID